MFSIKFLINSYVYHSNTVRGRNLKEWAFNPTIILYNYVCMVQNIFGGKNQDLVLPYLSWDHLYCISYPETRCTTVETFLRSCCHSSLQKSATALACDKCRLFKKMRLWLWKIWIWLDLAHIWKWLDQFVVLYLTQKESLGQKYGKYSETFELNLESNFRVVAKEIS